MCQARRTPRHARLPRCRGGLTLVELMIASSIMTIMCGAMAALAMALQQSSEYNYGHSTALQHARVTLERINRIVSTAYTAPGHPGVAVYVDTVGTYRYPDTLIVWQPSGMPTNLLGPPLIGECVFYCCDPSNPANLIEFTSPGDARTIPFDATLQTTGWRTTLNSLKTAGSSQKTTLTTLLRQCALSSGGSIPTGMATTRGAVRFELTVTPSTNSYSSYLAGTTTWTNLAWPQGLYGSQYGMRSVWLRTELQLMPVQKTGQQDPTGTLCLPFFGSTVLQEAMTP
jgi:pilin/secretion family protein with methylation motif